MTTMYCIEHEETFEVVSTDFCPMVHDLGTVAALHGDAVVIEPNYCCFDDGWASCPPPEEFWITSPHVEPDCEEMAALNEEASALYTDWY